MINMGRPKGGKNKKWTFEDRLKFVKMNLDDHISPVTIESGFGVSRNTLYGWVVKYLRSGEEGLVNKKLPGNKIAALTSSKNLSREEYLELENIKLNIEIERLKKGYLVKGDGAKKEFVSIKDVNTKSSKN